MLSIKLTLIEDKRGNCGGLGKYARFFSAIARRSNKKNEMAGGKNK